MAEPISLRPHHGLCFAYFVGKGYSSEFKKHMGEVLDSLGDNTCICLTASVDDVCSACPHNHRGICDENEKVLHHDNAVLQACGLHNGQKITLGQFAGLVQRKIINVGLRKGICGECQWQDICDRTPSRWREYV